MLYCGDCLSVMQTFEENSIDALCLDPPAGVSFMGSHWDSDKGGRKQWIAWMTEVMQEALRVAKPGAHMFCWALPRTSHWTATAIEDAGWEVRDVVTHHFATGFPKSLAVGKAIDKAAGVDREVIGRRTDRAATPKQDIRGGRLIGGANGMYDGSAITAPATDAARQWDGWGTALKPSAEMWILARKPLEKGLGVAANVLKWGTGALNIDASRIGTSDNLNGGAYSPETDAGHIRRWEGGEFTRKPGQYQQPSGRWPSNTLFSHAPGCVPLGVRRVKAGTAVGEKATSIFGTVLPEKGHGTAGYAAADGTEPVDAWRCVEGCPIRLLELQAAGMRASKPSATGQIGAAKGGASSIFGNDGRITARYDDVGVSRFFKTFPPEVPRFVFMSKASRGDRTNGGVVENGHPTCKNTELMKYLLTLCVPPGGVVLDCFAGSGSTLVAVTELGMDWIGIEAEQTYYDIAAARILDAELRLDAERAIPLLDWGVAVGGGGTG